jgi:predicted DNA-binding protein
MSDTREDTHTIAVRTPVSVHDELVRLAAEDQRPVSQIVRFAIDEYLRRKRDTALGAAPAAGVLMPPVGS